MMDLVYSLSTAISFILVMECGRNTFYYHVKMNQYVFIEPATGATPAVSMFVAGLQ